MGASTHRARRGQLRRLVALAALALAVMAIDARAELLEIAWDRSGRFETTASVAPGKFVEVCGRLDKWQSVAWSFKADLAMNFNIHYHEGKQVVFPAQQDAVADVHGKLDVSVSQDYCWMWTSKANAPIRLRLTLQK